MIPWNMWFFSSLSPCVLLKLSLPLSSPVRPLCLSLSLFDLFNLGIVIFKPNYSPLFSPSPQLSHHRFIMCAADATLVSLSAASI